MERRTFFQFPAVGSAIAASAVAQESDTSEAPGLMIGHPAVMAPRSNGVEIVWRVSALAKGHVEYGKTKKMTEVARGDSWGLRPAGTEAIRVRLDRLEPGTSYFYRVVTETFDTKNPRIEKGEVRSFRTLDPENKTTSFAVWNDTHKHNDTIDKLASLTPQSDFLLWNGDISNDWNKEGEVAETIITPGEVGKIDVSEKGPLVVLRGNHDLRGTQAYQVEDHVATPAGKPWFAFRSGPVAVICMDTGEDKPDDHPHLFGRVACEPMRREQAKWLEKTIAEPEIRDAPYRLVFCHIPLRWTDEKTDFGYDWYSKRSRDLWHDSLVQWGAQMVISGHTHRDAHLEASADFPYAQLVGGGPKADNARLITGKASPESLVLTMADLNGKVVRTVELLAII